MHQNEHSSNHSSQYSFGAKERSNSFGENLINVTSPPPPPPPLQMNYNNQQANMNMYPHQQHQLHQQQNSFQPNQQFFGNPSNSQYGQKSNYVPRMRGDYPNGG